MTEQVQTRYQPSTYERWALRILIGILVTLVGWIGVRAINEQDDTAQSVRDLGTQIVDMKRQLADLTTQASDTSALTRQVAAMQQVQSDHERRIERIEDRHP